MGRLIWAGLFLVIFVHEQSGAKKIDLNKSLVPTSVEDFPLSMASDFIKARIDKLERLGGGRKPVGTKTFAAGTNIQVSHDRDYKGFLSVVLTVYAHHLTLVTSPEDWWLTIVQRVAAQVDRNSKKDTVRKHFVAHEEKKKIVVDIRYIKDIEADFFYQISQQVAKNLKDPEYVSNLHPDFSTTTPLHGIVGNIAMMSSLQEYFEYRGRITCGIPGIDMKGTLADWEKLTNKFADLRDRLAPISGEIGLATWWVGVEEVLNQLLNTFKGKPDIDWWNQIIEKREKFVGCGTETVWNGWFLEKFMQLPMEEVQSSLLSVPLIIDDNGLETESALVAGMAGFILDQNQTSIAAQHAWNLMLEPDSYLRKDKALIFVLKAELKSAELVLKAELKSVLLVILVCKITVCPEF